MALKKIGVLWTKEDKKQKKFLSGQLDFGCFGTASIMVFEETKKKSAKSPDYKIYLNN